MPFSWKEVRQAEELQHPQGEVSQGIAGNPPLELRLCLLGGGPLIVLESVQLAERDVPDYIEADHNKMTATFGRVPALSDVPYAVQMEPNLVVEFYSR